jgi:uncharacterized protein YegP (UPF0339 family)
MFFVLYQDAQSQWRWTLYATNNKKIADSAESYWNKADAKASIGLVKSTHVTTPVHDALTPFGKGAVNIRA